MASYHFAAQIIGRSKGRSAVAAAAYRAGEKLTHSRGADRSQVFDFAKRRGVVHTEILLPEGVPKWLGDRQKLWSHVEKIEKRRDAQLAREINLALPAELDHQDRVALLREFVRAQFVSRGMIADVAVHEPVHQHGDDPRNHHAHIMLPLRMAAGNGLRRVKTRAWNSDSLLLEWRKEWAAHQNRWLKFRGWDVRVDHRTLQEQMTAAMERGDRAAAASLDRLPEIHVGPRARAIVRNGREPTSRERQVRSRANTQRIRHYPRHDAGSRVQHVLRRAEINADRLDRKITRFSERAVQFRLRRQVFDRQEFEARVARQRLRAFSRNSRQTALLRDIIRSPHRAQRRGLLDELVRDLDALVNVLMGQREAILERRRSWVRRPLRSPERSLRRARRPRGPSSAFP
ncbi:hypothetical protein FM996_02250 [Methylosinus sporium]|uniref:MobA/MobL protein domain-containing protein n=1 Tax=Methylosinus sporium TaxID=428 RepID=A0A549T6V4_METSR|nr:MobQ family relaxase [Methylosinus sporium]TRL37601.1 hypothetical protein FM996_02250 [Methylosinus sporium]